MTVEPMKSPTANQDTGEDNVFDAVNTVNQQLSAIETFIARRFDEISMEINATSQQVDMAEEGIGQRFAEILEVVKAISFHGGGLTPANTGVELDAVVDMTEKAAVRIMDAADRISASVAEHADKLQDEESKQAIEKINQDVEEIFMACSFQDVTGQRIRKTLDNLKMIEERLGTALKKMGVEIEDISPSDEVVQQGASQDDIDAMFSGDDSET